MARKACAYDAPNHSSDRAVVYHGRPEPTILCGYHASEAWLTTVLNSLSGRGQ